MTPYEAWCEWNKDLESSQRFIDVSFYFAISAALERRVWLTAKTPEDDNAIFPNFFPLFVGPPAAGKSRAMRKSWSVLKEVKDLQGARRFSRAAGNTTPAALVRSLAESGKEFPRVGIDPYKYYYMIVHAEELGVLLKDKDKDMPNLICQFYDSFEFDKKTITADCYDLENICVGMLACCTPTWIRDSFDASLFGQGFMSRFIPTYSAGPRFTRDCVDTAEEDFVSKKIVVDHLKKLADVYGKVRFTPDAIKLRKFLIEDKTHKMTVKRVNNSPYLNFYYDRKRLHWFKLSVAMHFAESTELMIDAPVMMKAFDFLGDLETDMHMTFDEMSKNELAQYYNPVLEEILRNPRGVSNGSLVKTFSRDLNFKQLGEVLEYLKATKQIDQQEQRFIAKGKAQKPKLQTVHDTGQARGVEGYIEALKKAAL